MTKDELVERARRQLAAWPDSEIDLGACVLQAKSNVAHVVMRDDSRRSLLQQDYSVALNASGVGDLLAATGAIAGEILMEGIEFGAVIDADGNILQLLIHYHDFIRPQDTNYAYCCRKGRNMHTRAINAQVNRPNEIQGVTGPITITANFEPTSVDDFPSELEPDLVDALCSVIASTNAQA